MKSKTSFNFILLMYMTHPILTDTLKDYGILTNDGMIVNHEFKKRTFSNTFVFNFSCKWNLYFFLVILYVST